MEIFFSCFILTIEGVTSKTSNSNMFIMPWKENSMLT